LINAYNSFNVKPVRFAYKLPEDFIDRDRIDRVFKTMKDKFKFCVSFGHTAPWFEEERVIRIKYPLSREALDLQYSLNDIDINDILKSETSDNFTFTYHSLNIPRVVDSFNFGKIIHIHCLFD
jgi:hypothetical protein